MICRIPFVGLLTIFWVFTGAAIAQESGNAFSPQTLRGGNLYPITTHARLIADSDIITRGMVWRVFDEQEDEEGQLPLVATAEGGSATFNLPSGSYLIHAAFGRAGATRRVSLGSDGVEEDFVLEAGGLELNAEINGREIETRKLRFSIFEVDDQDEGERKAIAINVPAKKVLPLNAGTYHVLSRYGRINATVRADLEVTAGQVTRATLQHRGAEVSLRLVSESGGDPVANTAWTVFTQDGEKVFDSRSIAPSLVLAEGEYEASVRNGERTLRKPFQVEPGKNIRVEILLQ